jgi:hypothetical protein
MAHCATVPRAFADFDSAGNGELFIWAASKDRRGSRPGSG